MLLALAGREHEVLTAVAVRAGERGRTLLVHRGRGIVQLVVPPEDRGKAAEALRDLITVPFKFDMSGCRIALYQPDGL